MDMSNPWRVRWDYLMLVMMVYVIIFTPYYIAFSVSTVSVMQNVTVSDEMLAFFVWGWRGYGDGGDKALYIFLALTQEVMLASSPVCLLCCFTFQADLTSSVAAFDLAVNCVFMTDILLNFRTSFPGAGGM